MRLAHLSLGAAIAGVCTLAAGQFTGHLWPGVVLTGLALLGAAGCEALEWRALRATDLRLLSVEAEAKKLRAEVDALNRRIAVSAL